MKDRIGYLDWVVTLNPKQSRMEVGGWLAEIFLGFYARRSVKKNNASGGIVLGHVVITAAVLPTRLHYYLRSHRYFCCQFDKKHSQGSIPVVAQMNVVCVSPVFGSFEDINGRDMVSQ